MNLPTTPFLLMAPVFWCAAHAQSPTGPAFDVELSKQTAIYQSQGENTPEGYVVDRTLSSYISALPVEFDRSLARLGPGERWLDIGAGRGQAVLDYFAPEYESRFLPESARGLKGQAVALSIEDRRTPLWYKTAATVEANKLKYLFGKPLSGYAREELGQFQVITDFLGGFSYTATLSRFMGQVLSLLSLNGSFYTILQDVRAETGVNRPHYPGARFLTELAHADGAELKVCAWLKSIGCVEVSCALRPNWKPPVEVYQVRKVCDAVSVPALLPTHFEAGTPPERRFQLDKPKATPITPPEEASATP